jgi:hypothetical protein
MPSNSAVGIGALVGVGDVLEVAVSTGGVCPDELLSLEEPFVHEARISAAIVGAINALARI